MNYYESLEASVDITRFASAAAFLNDPEVTFLFKVASNLPFVATVHHVFEEGITNELRAARINTLIEDGGLQIIRRNSQPVYCCDQQITVINVTTVDSRRSIRAILNPPYGFIQFMS